MSYKTIIIGGGISGLYAGYQLLKKNGDFIILEKGKVSNKKCYSKLCSVSGETINKKKFSGDRNFIMELGASVIHSKQPLILKLIKELGLENDLIKIGNPKMYRYSVSESNEVIKSKFNEINKKINDKLNVIPVDFTVKDACKAFLTSDEYKLYRTFYPEWYEIAHQNANVFFPYQSKIGDYMILKNGFGQIIDALLYKLQDKILFNSEVESVQFINDKYSIIVKGVRRAFTSKGVWLCSSLQSALGIRFTGIDVLYNYLYLGRTISSMRMYVLFKTPINIDYKFIVGEFSCKWSIKITDNLWLISYTDDKLADQLNKYSEEELAKMWIEDMNKIFNLEIRFSDIVLYSKAYWQDAFTILNKNFYEVYGDINYGTYIRRLLPPSLKVSSLPKGQGEETAWMESHLLDVS